MQRFNSLKRAYKFAKQLYPILKEHTAEYTSLSWLKVEEVDILGVINESNMDTWKHLMITKMHCVYKPSLDSSHVDMLLGKRYLDLYLNHYNAVCRQIV